MEKRIVTVTVLGLISIGFAYFSPGMFGVVLAVVGIIICLVNFANGYGIGRGKTKLKAKIKAEEAAGKDSESRATRFMLGVVLILIGLFLKQNTRAQFYVSSIFAQLPWIIIAVKAVLDIKKSRQWPQVFQAIGAGMSVVWKLVSFLLWTVWMSAERPEWWLTWMRLQSYVLGSALTLFAIGYFFSGKKTASKN